MAEESDQCVPDVKTKKEVKGLVQSGQIFFHQKMLSLRSKHPI